MFTLGAARLLGTRAALRAARSPLTDTLLGLAKQLAGNDPAANAAVYYVALRYFGFAACGRAAALSAARHELTTPTFLQPFAELGTTKRERQLARALQLVEEVLYQLTDSNAGGNAARGHQQLSRALTYARSMLRGDFVDAYPQWCELDDTQNSLAALNSPLPRSAGDGKARRWSKDATLAVVLPGAPDLDRREEIESHTVVARTAWAPHYIPKPETGTRTDVAFLNQDRFVGLMNSEFFEQSATTQQMPLIVTKPSAESCAKPVPAGIASRVEFALIEPVLPTSATTYLPVPVATWAVANFERPATLYFADFFLGDSFYHDTNYDRKRFLETASDVRRSYFAHDVFFVHAALQKWMRGGKILAPGKLGEILTWRGDEFAQHLQRRWGR